MRSHRVILRQIAEQNLDPRVAHVASKDGSLIPKSHVKETAKDDTVRPLPTPVVEEKTVDEPKPAEEVKVDPVATTVEVEASVESIAEEKTSLEETNVAVVEEDAQVPPVEPVVEAPKKKAPPPKKKKTTAE